MRYRQLTQEEQKQTVWINILKCAYGSNQHLAAILDSLQPANNDRHLFQFFLWKIKKMFCKRRDREKKVGKTEIGVLLDLKHPCRWFRKANLVLFHITNCVYQSQHEQNEQNEQIEQTNQSFTHFFHISFFKTDIIILIKDSWDIIAQQDADLMRRSRRKGKVLVLCKTIKRWNHNEQKVKSRELECFVTINHLRC